MGGMMSKRTSWPLLSAVILLLATLIAGCQGESPTAPPPPGTGPNTPVTSPTVTVTVSNRNPQAGGTTQIEVTVTKGGQAVPDGTPVEMLTDHGFFVESNSSSLFRTTVGGRVTVNLTATTSGTADVVIRVSDVIKRETIVFGVAPVTVVLTATDSTPDPGDQTTITATISQNGELVADGIIVEFVTNFGVFTDTQTNTATRITSAGKASVTLTSSQGGTATVTARAKDSEGGVLGEGSTIITFQAGTAATITSISPTSGSPAGNVQVTIRGSNFIAPVRVFFDTKEAAVVSVTPIEIVVLTPIFEMGASTPTKEVTVTVVNQAGSLQETSVTANQRFTFTIPILTPIVYSVSPSSGPNEGNTQITLFGEQFQSPVKVFFVAGGTETEAELKHVTFSEITLLSPPAVGLGSHLLNQTASMRVVNVFSNTSVTLPNAFRYGPEILITAVSPLQGSTQGGTQVTIEGYGFDDPVTVVIGGIVAQPVEVFGTRIVAITGTPLVTSCANVTGPISVTNRETGETATAAGLTFTFLAPRPTFVSVSPNPVTEGTAVSLTLSNPGSGLVQFQIGGKTVVPTGTTVTGNETTFTMVVPLGLPFDEIRCGTNNVGRQFDPLPADLVFTNLTTGCTASLDDALVVNPTDLSCRFANASVSPAAMAFNTASGTTSPAQTVTITNSGGTDLTVGSPSLTQSCTAGAGTFAIAPTAGATVPPAATASYAVTFSPTTAAAACTGSITFPFPNDPTPPPAPHVTLTGTSP